MYDAKLEEKDETLKYNTIADQSYFDKIPDERIITRKSSYIPTENIFK